jgi:DNA repair protein RecO (recombination protein O)
MAALVSGDWRLSDASEPAARRECSGLVAAHLQWHLERGLRSLPLVDRSGPAAPTTTTPTTTTPTTTTPTTTTPTTGESRPA